MVAVYRVSVVEWLKILVIGSGNEMSSVLSQELLRWFWESEAMLVDGQVDSHDYTSLSSSFKTLHVRRVCFGMYFSCIRMIITFLSCLFVYCYLSLWQAKNACLDYHHSCYAWSFWHGTAILTPNTLKLGTCMWEECRVCKLR